MSTKLSPIHSLTQAKTVKPRLTTTLCALALSLSVAPFASVANAQTFHGAETQTPAPASSMMANLSLPDSPGATLSGSDLSSSVEVSSSVDAEGAASREASPATTLNFAPAGYEAAYFQNLPPNNSPVARRYDKYIKPGQQAPRLSVNDKFVLGVKDAFSPLAFIGWATAAEYSQLVNGSPNYGTNGKAFLQRFGAAAARASSQGIFSDSIMASVLHEDPRYYKMGKGHNVLKRIVYAGTRPIITRTDGGRQTINLAYLSGNLAGAALTQAYYPPVNRGFSQVAQTWGGSIGGGAIGFLSAEFLDDILQGLHLQKAR